MTKTETKKEVEVKLDGSQYSCQVLLEKCTLEQAKDKSFPTDARLVRYKIKDSVDVFGIDEAQFSGDGIIDITNKLAREDKRIVIAGLDKDYTGKSFGPIHQLLVDAEYVSKVNAICISCGDPASFSQRISSEKDLVVVGETDKYEARCRKCFKP